MCYIYHKVFEKFILKVMVVFVMKRFNTEGPCNRERDYMVNIDERVEKIAGMIREGDYFCINRSRQYGKTTTLQALLQGWILSGLQRIYMPILPVILILYRNYVN